MLSDSLFKHISYVHVTALSAGPHLKQILKRMFAKSSAVQIVKLIERSLLTIPPSGSNRSVLYTCVYTYVHPLLPYERVSIYTIYIHVFFFFFCEIKAWGAFRRADIFRRSEKNTIFF